METKKTFLFIRGHMGIGGIETYIYRTVKKLKSDGHRIIWLFPKGGYIDDSFKGELVDEAIEIIDVNFEKAFWINNLNIKFDENEQVFALSFNLFNFMFLEMIKKKYSNIQVDSFFWVPHFEEKYVFLELFAPKFIRPLIRKFLGKVIYEMDQNNNIIYVNQSHLDALTHTYQYQSKNGESMFLKGSNRDVLPYNNEVALVRSERKIFNIITVGRFSFPHKSYVLGLIKSYGKLKEKYNKLQLTIIGYGTGEDRVLNEIDNLSDEAKKDVNLVGKVPYLELRKYFENAHVNIGVAGTIVDGSLTGLISIPVRHYSEICEGYGYLPDSSTLTISSEPGTPIEVFIEELLNVQEEKYLELSEASYKTYSQRATIDSTEYLLQMTNYKKEKCANITHILLITLAYYVMKLLKK